MTTVSGSFPVSSVSCLGKWDKRGPWGWTRGICPSSATYLLSTAAKSLAAGTWWEGSGLDGWRILGLEQPRQGEVAQMLALQEPQDLGDVAREWVFLRALRLVCKEGCSRAVPHRIEHSLWAASPSTHWILISGGSLGVNQQGEGGVGCNKQKVPQICRSLTPSSLAQCCCGDWVRLH